MAAGPVAVVPGGCLDIDELSLLTLVVIMRDAADVNGAALLTSAVRRRIVEHLAELPRLAAEGPTRERGLTAAELGRVLGLHTTTIRFHLDQLVAAGILRSQFVRSGGAGRPAKRYVVEETELGTVVAGSSEGPYQILATLLADALAEGGQEGVSPEAAGRDWVRRRMAARAPEGGTPTSAGTPGEWVGKVGAVVDLLSEWGYVPDLAVTGQEGDVTLTLHDCPFRDLARVHPDIVCGVHLGLLRGALESAGEDQAGVSLQPFVTPTTCSAVLLRRGAHPLPTPIVRHRGETA